MAAISQRTKRALWSAAIALALLAAIVGATWLTLVRTDSGTAWLLARVAGLSVASQQGRLFGGPFSAERIELKLPDRTIVIEGLAWQDARWTWRPHAGAWVGLAIEQARARRVDIGASSSTAPLAEPTSLRLPLALSLTGARVGELALDRQTIARDLAASLDLGAERGAVHRLSATSLRTERATFSGQASLAADAPFALEAALRADSLAGASPAWTASAGARGPLAAISLDARLTSSDAGGARLDAQAALAPFAAWPLAALQARIDNLDLEALQARAPRTKLSGQARIDARGLDQPIHALIELTNADAGRWDQQRLPMAGLTLDLSGKAKERDVLAVQSLEWRAPGDGGRVTGQGQWREGNATLDLTLHALKPAALDARAPAMTLGGTLAARMNGLPTPSGSRAAAGAQQLEARLALEGMFDARRAERVVIDGELKAQRDAAQWSAALDNVSARSGGAQLKGRFQAQRTGEAAVQITSQGEALNFDPSPWWPGAPAARLQAHWRAELQSPGAALPHDAAGWLAARGQAALELRPDSTLGGVPLRGQLTLEGRARPGWSVDAQAQAAGNTLKAQGQLAVRASDDRWRAELDAPALAALTPLAAALGRKAAFDGNASGQLNLSGRWPAMRATGSLRGAGLRLGAWAAQKLDAQWQAGPDRDAPLSLTLEGEKLAQGNVGIDNLRAAVEGTMASHRIALEATSALRPPTWTDALLGAKTSVGRGSRLQLRAEGHWQPGGNAPLAGQWQAQLQELDARGRDAAVSWLAARDARLDLQFDADGRLLQAQALPGRAMVLGAPFAWREARWSPATKARREQFALDADLETLPIAPWLVRWQPEAGFGGDLTLKGHALIKSGETFAADLVLERVAGDLTVTEEGDTQSLGLTDLRLALAAEGGTWHFTQAIAGANMGVLVGAQSVRIAPTATWPASDAPMEGVLEWRVSDLGAWARFMPPGWRVAGQLRTSAAVGGRFGAPEIEGRMEGSGLAVRNLLQGVDVRDGELAVSLRGADARIERFVFKGGDGELRLTGGAALGAEPKATLSLAADKFRLLGRSDRRIVASGQAQLALDAKALALDGKFTIDEGLIDVARSEAPTLDADVTVRGGKHAARAAKPEPDDEPAPSSRPRPAPRDVRVNVQLDLGPQLRLRGRGLDTRLAGRVTITAPQGRLALNGQVRAQDGQYAAYGQKLEIERGVLAFSGEPGNPRLDILAIRPNLDVKVGVLITGTAQLPRVRLASEPEMSDYDKLSWLVLGRASDGLARADTALLQRAALALLAGEGEGANAALLANLGLDELSVRQNESGDTRETIVSLGKQLSRRWYVGYERSVNNTTGTWQLIYRAAQRFTLRAQSGAENSLDAIWTWRWN